jgi:hypothetical protein
VAPLQPEFEENPDVRTAAGAYRGRVLGMAEVIVEAVDGARGSTAV